MAVLAVGGVAALALVLAVSLRNVPAPQSKPGVVGWARVKDSSRIDGIERVNLWADYDNRSAGMSGAVYPGSSVTVLERRGEGCLVEDGTGQSRGWVTCDFLDIQ
jgi:hypothetical protein